MDDLNEFVLDIQQRRKRAMTMRRLARKMELARARMANRMSSPEQLKRKARHAAIEIVRKKVAGQKGLDYATLPDSEKIIIDKRVEQRKKIIDRIAIKMLPVVRKLDLAKVMHKKEAKPGNVNEQFEAFLEQKAEYIMPGKKLHEPEEDHIEPDTLKTKPRTFKDKVQRHAKIYDVAEQYLPLVEQAYNQIIESAGLEGTDELVKKYKKDTPGQDVNEAFENLFEEVISVSQMKDFEKFVDRMFKKFNIDFEFTKHFGERMNDDRNSPKIKLKELADLIKKIYAKNGNPLKGKPGAELVVKDLQSDLNMPVVIKYDAKNDEIDIVAKTIMRKKNFTSPDPFVKY